MTCAIARMLQVVLAPRTGRETLVRTADPTIRALVLVTLIAPLGCAQPAPQTASTQPAAKIAEFQGSYRFLSNFWPTEVVHDGITYPTVEHAYQAAKTLDLAERRRIAALPTPADAKKAGRAVTLRDDWERVKFDVMEQCVRYKFARHPDLAAKLLATGAATLEEGNTWGDRVWGVYQGQGKNRLGLILMKIRGELRPAAPAGLSK